MAKRFSGKSKHTNFGSERMLIPASPTIIEDLQRFCYGNESYRTAYYYFDFNDAEKCSSENLLRSLICQLLPKDSIPQALQTLFIHCQDRTQQPSSEDLLSVLKAILEEECTTFIVDALDECTDRSDLISMFQEICGWGNPRMKLLFLNQKEWEMVEPFRDLQVQQIAIEGSYVRGNIKILVEASLRENPRLRKWPASVQKELKEILTTSANGM